LVALAAQACLFPLTGLAVRASASAAVALAFLQVVLVALTLSAAVLTRAVNAVEEGTATDTIFAGRVVEISRLALVTGFGILAGFAVCDARVTQSLRIYCSCSVLVVSLKAGIT